MKDKDTIEVSPSAHKDQTSYDQTSYSYNKLRYVPVG